MLPPPATHQTGLACAQQIGHAQPIASIKADPRGVAFVRRPGTGAPASSPPPPFLPGEEELGLVSDDDDGAKVADETLCHGAVLLSTNHARLGGRGIDSARQTTSCVTYLTGGHRRGGGVLKGT